MRIRAVKIGIVTVIASAALWGSSGVAAAGGGCMHSTGPTTGRGDQIQMSDMCFDATVLYVDRGTQVTWTNRDQTDHNVVGVGGTWGDMELMLSRGDAVSYRFDDDGVFPFACWIHPGMIGAVVVGDGVGTDRAAVVPGTTAGGDAGSAEVASAPLVQSGGDDTAIWVVGTLVVGALAGAFAVAMRNRRKEPVAG